MGELLEKLRIIKGGLIPDKTIRQHRSESRNYVNNNICLLIVYQYILLVFLTNCIFI